MKDYHQNLKRRFRQRVPILAEQQLFVNASNLFDFQTQIKIELKFFLRFIFVENKQSKDSE